MTLLADVQASHDAQRTWARMSALLSLYWRRQVIEPNRYYDDLGVRVDGLITDPMAIVRYVVSADMAVNHYLRKRCPKAFFLVCWEIEHPWQEHDTYRTRWFTGRGTGPGEIYKLEYGEARRLLEGAKEYLHWVMETDDMGVEPEEVRDLLG